MKNRNGIIEILRIIAAVSVFTGHFLGIEIASEKSVELLRFLRESIVGRTMLAYFYEGDIAVAFFFVIGGFFITYNYNNDEKYIDKFYEQELRTVVPAIFIPILHAIVLCVINQNTSSVFSAREDIITILSGGLSLNLSYQLWFIHYLAVGYFLIYAVMGITKDKEKRKIVLLCIFGIYCYKYNVYVGEVIIGALFGCIRKRRKFIKESKYILFLVLFLLVMGPLVYYESNINNFSTYLLAVIFSLLISLSCSYNNDNINKLFDLKLMSIWQKNTFSFYLVHIIVLNIFGKVYSRIVNVYDSYGYLLIFYLFSIVVTIIMADIYRRCIIDKVNKFIKLIVG